MRYIVGSIGSDQGYWVLDDTGWHHEGGWGIESLLEVQSGLAVLKASTQLKTPGLANAVAEQVTKAIGPELAKHLDGDSTIFIV